MDNFNNSQRLELLNLLIRICYLELYWIWAAPILPLTISWPILIVCGLKYIETRQNDAIAETER